MRRHELVHESEESNTFLIYWEPGSGLDWHTHGESAASIILLHGRLYEYRLASGAEPQGASEVLYPDHLYVRHRSVTHRVENRFDETAVSLHTYCPPLAVEYGPELELNLNG